MDVLTIGGTSFRVKSLSISHEKIWSKNAGRVANGEFRGDVIATKIKLQIIFCPMSDEQAASLDAAIKPAFLNVRFRNPETGALSTKTMYAGTPTYPVYSYVTELPRYVGVGVDLVEQ